MKLVPYKHPLMGWYFDWKVLMLLDGAVWILNKFACKWNSEQPLRIKPIRIRRWPEEPSMYIWLKFNISLSNGWGIGMTYD